MDFLFAQLSIIRKNYFLLLICLLLIIINDAIILGDFYILKSKKATVISDINIANNEKSNYISNVNVDIKGYVKKPGVYEVSDGMTVNDVIKLAGGLKKNASTDNINLSKKVFDQMVIIVYSNKINKDKSYSSDLVNDALIKNEESALITNMDSTTQNTSKLVNINTATTDELLNITGIGQSKADAIISYRNNSHFNSIEDIKNVPGIGDALFEKIKDSITV